MKWLNCVCKVDGCFQLFTVKGDAEAVPGVAVAGLYIEMAAHARDSHGDEQEATWLERRAIEIGQTVGRYVW